MAVVAGIPTSFKLYDAAVRIIEGKGYGASRWKIVPVADSLGEVSNQYSIATAMRSMFRPNLWVGANIHADVSAGVDSALGRHFSTGGAFTTTTMSAPGLVLYEDQVTAAGNLTSRYTVAASGTFPGGGGYPAGAETRVPCFARYVSFETATTHEVRGGAAMTEATCATAQAASFNGTGNWTIGQVINFDHVFYKNPNGFQNDGGAAIDTFTVRPTRGGSTTGCTLLTGQTCYAASDSEAWEKYTGAVHNGTGQAKSQILTGAGDTTGLDRRMYYAGCRVYVPTVTYGTELLNIWTNGSAAATDIDDAMSRAEDTSSWCYAWSLNEGAIFFVFPGTNRTSAEAADFPGVWQVKVQSIVDKIRTAVLATAGAVPPHFVMIPPYENTQTDATASAAMQLAMYNIARTNPDCSFLNLNRLAGSFTSDLDTSGYLQSDNIHPTYQNTNGMAQGMDYFASLMWGELVRVYNAGPGTLRLRRL